MIKRESIKKMKNKGFTLIELIVVIAVLGVLVLMAAPKFSGYTAEAKLTQIKNDINSHETSITAKLTKDEEAFSSWKLIPEDEIDAMITSGKVINKKGEIIPELDGDNFIIEENLDVKSKLKGVFIWTDSEDVVYYDENMSLDMLSNSNGNDGNNNGGNSGSGNNGNSVTDGSGSSNLADTVDYAPETDFTFVADSNGYVTAENPTTKGYYKYIGNEEEVLIPENIKGTEMTSYYRMFYQDTSDNTVPTVKKVISKNDKLVNVDSMFYNSKIEQLDVSELDTSSVKDMRRMFQNSKAQSLDVSNFDTSNATDMRFMFSGTVAQNIDVSNFDVSNVTTMASMFLDSNATTINIGNNFDSSKVVEMTFMFAGTEAKTLNLNSMKTDSARDMSFMFQNSKAEELDLSNFNTSNATNMTQMFASSEAKTLNLTSFDTSKVTSISLMFSKSKATVFDLSSFAVSHIGMMGVLGGMFEQVSGTVGYARTAADAAFLNGTMAKPAGLTFVVK